MTFISMREVVIFLLALYIAAASGYTRAQSNSWKEWINGFFE